MALNDYKLIIHFSIWLCLFIKYYFTSYLLLCSCSSSLKMQKMWRLLYISFFLYISSQALFLSAENKPSTGCLRLSSPCVFFLAPPEVWYNQAVSAECGCDWSYNPSISSAADDQTGRLGWLLIGLERSWVHLAERGAKIDTDGSRLYCLSAVCNQIIYLI